MNVEDKSGFVVFSRGDIGSAHVLAHRALDSGRIELGRRQLGRWLEGRSGSGSEWAHIQFHMAVFELESGDWDAAHSRFVDEVLPIAASSEDALTDAPALAWRLALRAEGRRFLPWEPLRRTALGALNRPAEPFAELHNLLALAGARDAGSLDRWLRDRAGKSGPSDVVSGFGEALGHYARGKYQRAAGFLKDLAPEVPAIGGSRAQNALFSEFGGWMEAA